MALNFGYFLQYIVSDSTVSVQGMLNSSSPLYCPENLSDSHLRASRGLKP